MKMKELHINYVTHGNSGYLVISGNAQSQPFDTWDEACAASDEDSNAWSSSGTAEDYENITPIEWVQK